MISSLELKPNSQIEKEILPADRFLFVLEGSIEQLIEGEFVEMIAKQRDVPDGTHGVTPRIDFVYIEKGSASAIKTGPDGANVLEVYSPFRLSTHP